MTHGSMFCQVVKGRFQQYARCNSYAWKQLFFNNFL